MKHVILVLVSKYFQDIKYISNMWEGNEFQSILLDKYLVLLQTLERCYNSS